MMGGAAATLLVCFTVCAVAPSLPVAPATVFVSPDGKDSNDGKTVATALKTLPAAQTAVRAALKTTSGQRDGVVVSLGEGVYRLAAPLMLSAEDSGSADAPVVWAGKEGAKISGSVAVTGWEASPASGKIQLVEAEVPAAVTAGARQMWVSGERAKFHIYIKISLNKPLPK
jgi:hypothetical protein